MKFNYLTDSSVVDEKDCICTPAGMYYDRMSGAKGCLGGSSRYSLHLGTMIRTRDRRSAKPEPVSPSKSTSATNSDILVDAKKPRAIEYRVNGKEVRNRIHLYIDAMRSPVLRFVTISFPPAVSDDIAVKLLNSLFTLARKHKKLKSYLWIAERQKNGTIHYHIAIPQKFVPISWLNAAVAGLMKTYIRKGILNFNIFLCRKYNGVDIAKDRATRKVIDFARRSQRKNLTRYLTKYLSKSDDKSDDGKSRATFAGRAWGCSHDFSDIFTTIKLNTNDFVRLGLSKFLHREKRFNIMTPPDHLGNTEIMGTFVPWSGDPPEFVRKCLAYVNAQILERGDAVIGLNFSFGHN